ncbi:hypothetical protein evm_014511 [Chilo suppressalis]|nr:hypothetical protein evm_014511 [Chilo suppressalis]
MQAFILMMRSRWWKRRLWSELRANSECTRVCGVGECGLTTSKDSLNRMCSGQPFKHSLGLAVLVLFLHFCKTKTKNKNRGIFSKTRPRPDRARLEQEQD